MFAPIREFGEFVASATYVYRPGGYAVVFNAAGKIAVVSTPRGHFLPGGGQEGAETPGQAAIREAHEECGLRIRLDPHFGTADELVFAAEEATYYRKRCAFFRAEAGKPRRTRSRSDLATPGGSRRPIASRDPALGRFAGASPKVWCFTELAER